MPDELAADTLAAKLNEWFPWARWECAMSGGYCCVWVTMAMGEGTVGEFTVKGDATERAARCRTWENARNEAKRWAWKQINAAKKGASDA